MNAETTHSMLPVSVLVIEHAGYSMPWLMGEGPGQMSNRGQLSPDVVVISQLPGEPPSTFATRALRRLARLDSAVVSRAVLACGARSDELSLSSRARISQALLASLQRASTAKLTLAAPPAASDSLRHQLLAIAGTLLEQSRAPGVGISVQLGDAGSARRHALTETAEIARKVA